MSDAAILESRRQGPTLDEVTTIIWTHAMGERMAIARMKILYEQKQIADKLGITQAAISRIELGHSRVCDRITVKQIKEVFGKSFPFIVFGTNAERYNAQTITRNYWDTRLRIQRRNKSPHSKRRG